MNTNYFRQSTPEEQIQAEIERAAKELHKMQVESAKLNDAHTEGVSVLYLEWGELHQEMKDWYISKSKQILCGHRLAIIDKSRERDNKVWHKGEELFEAYQAGKNDASLIIILLGD